MSSTFLDLVEERSAVITTLLNMDAMPAGMELFPATDDDAWTLIRQIIDESDYYLLVIGGRYGAIDPDTELSYTEKEFDYAVAQRKPVMAFIHGDPGEITLEKSEKSEEARAKLAAFREKVQSQKHVKYWTSAEALPGLVALSFPKLQRAHPAVGWVRGDVQTSAESLSELNALRKRLEEAERQVEAVRHSPPPETSGLAQGQDKISVPVHVTSSLIAREYPRKRSDTLVAEHSPTWDEIFAAVGPALIDEADQDTMKRKLDVFFAQEVFDAASERIDAEVADDPDLVSGEMEGGRIFNDDFDTILVQLRALGLIQQSDRKRSVKDVGSYWTLTPYGDGQLMKLRAIRRKTAVSPGDAASPATAGES